MMKRVNSLLYDFTESEGEDSSDIEAQNMPIRVNLEQQEEEEKTPQKNYKISNLPKKIVKNIPIKKKGKNEEEKQEDEDMRTMRPMEKTLLNNMLKDIQKEEDEKNGKKKKYKLGNLTKSVFKGINERKK